MAGHDQIPIRSFEAILKSCGGMEEKSLDSKKCQKALQIAEQQAGGYYPYHLYDDCIYENGFGRRGLQQLSTSIHDYPCGGDPVMNEYLSLPIVQDALHVQPPFFSVDNAVDFDYTSTERTVEPFVKSMQHKLKILIYNGDADPSINSFEAYNWTRHLNYDVLQDWRPYTTDACRRMAGYVVRYEGNLDFATIRGAGHMVPTYKAEAAFVMLQAFLGQGEYPGYNATCMEPTLQQRKQGSENKPRLSDNNRANSGNQKRSLRELI